MGRRLRILLINAPTTNQMKVYANLIPLEYVKKHHPIGLLYVGTYVKNMADVKVMDFDAEIKEEKYKYLVKEVLRSFEPDIVGLNAFSLTLYDAYEVAKIAKSENPKIITVFGGIHTSYYPYEMINQDFIDFIVQGEGEETFAEFISKFGTDDMYYIPGMISKKKNGRYPDIITNPKRKEIEDLDRIPFPDKDLLIDKKIYRNLLMPNANESIIISSRGCPYSCAYCQVSGKRYRFRSPKNIVDEMEFILSQGYNYADFFDDTMNIRKDRVKDICREIIKRGLHKRLRWKFRGVANLVDEEMVGLMKESGCDMAYIGIESGSDRVLKSVNRVVTTENCISAVKLFKKYGIKVMGYFILGLPGETEEEIFQTINFALSLPLDYIQVNVLIPVPGTSIYSMAINDEKFGADYFREYTIKPEKNTRQKFYETKVREERVKELQKYFYRKFYLRPGFIMKNIKNQNIHTAWYAFKTFMRFLKETLS